MDQEKDKKGGGRGGDGGGRRPEGRKRTLQRTDDEDEGRNCSVASLNSTLQSSLSLSPNQQQMMEGMLSELNSTLKQLCVGHDDKRIRTEVKRPEVRVKEDKMEEGTIVTTGTGTTVKNGEENEVLLKRRAMKRMRAKQVDRKRCEEIMATVIGTAMSAGGASNWTPDRDFRGVGSFRRGLSLMVENDVSSYAGDGGVGPATGSIPIPSTSKGIGSSVKGNGFEPTPISIPRKVPVVGDLVYAMFKNLERPWLLATVLDANRNDHTNQVEYAIRFEATNKRDQPTGGVLIPGETRQKMRQVTLKELAAAHSCPYQLPLGSRVIARLTDKEDHPNQAPFFAGIVAEHSKAKERPKHYLIFFDVGISQYVHADHVNLTLNNDRLVWNDVHPDTYDFIKEYIIRCPKWPLVLLRIGQIVATEWNGMWIPARIRRLDESLAYAQFENDGQCEWIFRGSSRFRPAPLRLLREEQRNIKGGILNQEEMSSWSPPSVKRMKKAKACSSYNGKDHYKQVLFFSGWGGGQVENDFMIELDDPTLCIEYQGRLRKVEFPKSDPEQKPFVEHYCAWFCVVPFTESEKFRKLSPLIIPLHFGWTRHRITEPMRHEVFYRAPCGVRLNDATTLNDFLKLTLCDFPIDYFSFDYDVDCENEFQAARVLLKVEDISNGTELRAISLVNSLDLEEPDTFEYLSESEFGPVAKVKVNQDQDFLVCCECEDGDCSDQDKCPCWQMTKQGVEFTKMNDENYPTQGYETRKLRDKLCGGIYECNDRCACKKSCTNRVVQNGCQWPLQVFKTRGKGWGVRTLFDIPVGTFVGYYLGEILDSDYADEMGKICGDEYFLQLDYIEMVSSAKAEFVEDVEMEGAGMEESMEEGDDADDEDDSMDEGASKDAGRRKAERDKERKKLKERRNMYGPKEDVYVVDSKRKGGVTRFMNHSCNPNLFPQNVFVNIQDLRFPMVAMFTNMLIKAGSELTWDYNYSVGAVAGMAVPCQCMAYNCKGRLL